MKREKKKWLKQHEHPLGGYVFAVFDRTDALRLPQLKLEEGTYARLLYLATYLDYNDQKLKKPRGKPMIKKDVEKMLGLSRAEFYRFWKEVTDAKCIMEDKDGGLLVPAEICFKGRVKPKRGLGLTRVHVKQMRELYKATPVRSHRYLGAVLKMLPYVSVKYNILCWNPFEEDIDEVQPVTLVEFCTLTGRGTKRTTEMRNAYKGIRFAMKDGISRPLCAFVRSTVGGGERDIIVVNPRVVFMGEDWRYVEEHIMHFSED